MSAEKIDRSAAAGPFNLEGWLVEPQLNRVSNGEVLVRLEPKAMAVLLCLVEHAGEVVSRRDLVDTVWATEFISDSTLTHTIADLRRALDDDARTPRFIETIPKRGYRLVAAAKDESRDEPSGRRSTAPTEPLAVIFGEKVRLGNRAESGLSDHFLFLGDQEIPLADPTIIFGRGQEADIQFLVSEVSRRHARLEVVPNAVLIEDLGSKNGTLVNNAPLASRLQLRSGDLIGIGPTTMIYRWLSAEPTRTQDDA